MSKDSPKLIIDDESGNFRLLWFFPVEDDVGAYVGDGGEVSKERLATAAAEASAIGSTSRENWEADAAAFCAQTTEGVLRDKIGLYWQTRSGAQTALRACKAVLAAGPSGGKWPEWAQKAAAEGWKPS